MAEVLTEPELRRTPDNQSSIASFLVQFAGSRPEDAPYRLKVVGWGNLADEIFERYHKGDQLVVEGRLRLDTVDRGTYKEKRTELVAQRIHGIGGVSSSSVAVETPRGGRSNAPSYAAPVNAAPVNAYVPAAAPMNDSPDLDDIPF